MADSWNSNPLYRFRRTVEADTHLPDDTRFHILLWLKKILVKYDPKDITQQTIVTQAAEQYMELQRISLAIKQVDVASPEYIRLLGARTKANGDMLKSLRIAGLSSKHMAKGKRPNSGSVFPPTRNRKKSELDAERVA